MQENIKGRAGNLSQLALRAM